MEANNSGSVPIIKQAEHLVVDAVTDLKKSLGSTTYPTIILTIHFFIFLVLFQQYLSVEVRNILLALTFAFPVYAVGIIVIARIFRQGIETILYIIKLIETTFQYRRNKLGHPASFPDKPNVFTLDKWTAQNEDGNGVGLAALIDNSKFPIFKFGNFQIATKMDYWRAGITIHYIDESDLVIHLHQDGTDELYFRAVYNIEVDKDKKDKLDNWNKESSLKFELVLEEEEIFLKYKDKKIKVYDEIKKEIDNISLVAWADQRESLNVEFINIYLECKRKNILNIFENLLKKFKLNSQ